MIRRFLIASRLMNTTDPGGGGGGGASVFSEDQINVIKSLVAGTVNATIAARDKMSDKKREQDAAKLREDFSAMLTEQLKALKPADPDDGGAGGGKGGGKGKESVELQTLRSQLSELANKAKQQEERTAAAEARLRSETLRRTTADLLAAAGVEGSRFKGAYALLQQEGRIKHRDDDSGEMVFVDDTGAEVDLQVGLSQWVKTDDAKMYLPPTGATGSGSRPATRQAGGPPAKPTKEQAFGLLGESLKSALNGE